MRIDNDMVEANTSAFTETPDRSRHVTLSDGTVCSFRPPKVKDIRELRDSGVTDEFQVSIRLTARICTKWGNKPGVTPIQLDELDISDFLLIQEALKPFLQMS
jgi:hypothetical protein